MTIVDANIKKTIDFFENKPGYIKSSTKIVAEALNVSYDDVAYARDYLRQKDNDAVRFEDLEDFIKREGINKDDIRHVWYKNKKFSVNTKKSPPPLDLELFAEKIKGYEIPDIPKHPIPPSDYFAVINKYDAHIDKLSFTGNGGKEEMYENLEVLWKHFNLLLSDTLRYNPDTIIYPFGNDFFTTNGRLQATRAGTPQHRLTHWHDSFEAGVEYHRRCIDKIRSYCNCMIVNIPGNHDHDLILSLGTIMKLLYKNQDRAFLNVDKTSRKYATIGDCLLGFGHGKVEKRRIRDLPTAMAIENDNFSKAKYRIFLLGDIHHSEEYMSLNKLEHNGVEIKFMRSCTSEDEWHNESLWIGARKSISSIVIRKDGSAIRTLENFF